MSQATKDKWATYSDGMRNALRTSVKDGRDSVSFAGRTEKEAVVLFNTPESPFQSAVYGDGDHNKYPSCYVLSDEIAEHARSLK